MAMLQHLELLKMGDQVWNQWRQENPGIYPDLSEADLRGRTLSRMDLSRSNLTGAILHQSKLRSASLCGAKLVRTDFSYANLSKVNFSGSTLDNANFKWADLREAELSVAKLVGVDLSEADLSSADLIGAILYRVNLCGAKLRGANLYKANFDQVNLSSTDLSTACLIKAHLNDVTLNDAHLWETQRAGWTIRNIICEAVYWDANKEEKTAYCPGEFERLFAEKVKVRLFYKGGINPLEIATLPALIRYLGELQPGYGLHLVKISEESRGAVVELAIENYGDKSSKQLKRLKAALEAEAKQKVEYQRQALTERDIRLQLEGELRRSDTVIDKLILRPAIILNNLVSSMGDTYNVSGQAGAVGANAHAHDVTLNQISNHLEKSINLDELAQQLAELRLAMAEKQDSSLRAVIAVGEVAKAEIAANEKRSIKVMEHLKAAGEWTLNIAKEIGKEVVVEAIKQSMGK